VLKRFSCAFTSYSELIIALHSAQVHKCTAAHKYWIFGKLTHCKTFTFYLKIVSIILERPWAVAQSVWRETNEDIWKN